MSAHRSLLAGCLILALGCPALAGAESTAQAMPEYMDMLGRAIAFQTVEGKDQVPAFARYLAGKLEAAGFAQSDIEIIPVEHTAALVVHYRGSDRALKPILLSAHMDVVAANADGWTDHDPFKLVKDGPYYYGRGVADMKDNTIALVETFMRLKREHFVPKREMILVFSGDEETDMASTRELAKRYHDAEFLLNADAGGGVYDADLKPVMFKVQAAEKTYADFLLTATSVGGHSSEPRPDNAIYTLAKALGGVAAYQFPVRYNAITLASFKVMGEHGRGSARLRGESARCRGHRDDIGRPGVRRPDPHHLRRDDVERWPRAQRAAGTRHRQRQLPDLPGRRHRVGAGGAREGDRQPRGQDHGAATAAGGKPGLAAAQGRDGCRGGRGAATLPGHRDRARDVLGRDRQHVLPQRGRAKLRRQPRLRQARRRTRARLQRTHAGDGIVRGARLLAQPADPALATVAPRRMRPAPRKMAGLGSRQTRFSCPTTFPTVTFKRRAAAAPSRSSRTRMRARPR